MSAQPKRGISHDIFKSPPAYRLELGSLTRMFFFPLYLCGCDRRQSELCCFYFKLFFCCKEGINLFKSTYIIPLVGGGRRGAWGRGRVQARLVKSVEAPGGLQGALLPSRPCGQASICEMERTPRLTLCSCSSHLLFVLSSPVFSDHRFPTVSLVSFQTL